MATEVYSALLYTRIIKADGELHQTHSCCKLLGSLLVSPHKKKNPQAWTKLFRAANGPAQKEDRIWHDGPQSSPFLQWLQIKSSL